MRILTLFTIVVFYSVTVLAQVTGGQFAMEFLRMANSPHVSALGSINVANPTPDVSLGMQNPALLRPGLHNQLSVNYNNYYADISVMNLAYGYYVPSKKTTFGLGVQYLNYGELTQTNISGIEEGTLKANDYAISLAASRQYGEHWRYGATLKYAGSNLGAIASSALLADVGIVYYDTATLWSIGATAKNMGFMLAKYTPGSPAEPMPFDLQIGLSKRFKHLPLRLMATLHHLYEWDVRYNNPADVDRSNLFGTEDTTADSKSYFADKLFRHLIFAAEITLGKRLAVTAGYNHLRRGELGLKDRMALAGFSFGASIYLNKFQLHYARSYYHLAGAYNEIGLNLTLNRLIPLGKSAERLHWADQWEDWGMY